MTPLTFLAIHGGGEKGRAGSRERVALFLLHGLVLLLVVAEIPQQTWGGIGWFVRSYHFARSAREFARMSFLFLWRRSTSRARVASSFSLMRSMSSCSNKNRR